MLTHYTSLHTTVEALLATTHVSDQLSLGTTFVKSRLNCEKTTPVSNLAHIWDPAHSLMSRAMSHVWPVNTLFQIGLITNCVRNYPIKNADICLCDSAGFDCELIRARSTRNNGKK